MPRLSSISKEFCFLSMLDVLIVAVAAADAGDISGCGTAPPPPLANESHRSIEQSRVQSGRSRPNENRCFALIASGASILPPPPLLQIDDLLFDEAAE